MSPSLHASSPHVSTDTMYVMYTRSFTRRDSRSAESA
jgi:hypothetical protein